jgi:hypothetical protein
MPSSLSTQLSAQLSFSASVQLFASQVTGPERRRDPCGAARLTAIGLAESSLTASLAGSELATGLPFHATWLPGRAATLVLPQCACPTATGQPQPQDFSAVVMWVQQLQEQQ